MNIKELLLLKVYPFTLRNAQPRFVKGTGGMLFIDKCFKYYMVSHYQVGHILLLTKTIKNSEVRFCLYFIIPKKRL